MARIRSNGIAIEVERFGRQSAPPVLLIAGFGSQLISWPDGLMDALVRHGCWVIAMDNRDAGLSEKITRAGVPDIATLRTKKVIARQDVPYTIDDMADDAAGVLDALGLEAVHVVGRSMDGLIAQALAARHPRKVLSLSLLVSTSAAPSLPAMRPDIEALLFGEGDAPAGRDAAIDLSVEADKAWASPAFPFDPARRRAQAAAAYDRCNDPAGTARQAAALLHALRARDDPRPAGVPTLIVQGMADTIFPPEHGRDLKARNPGARLLEVDGMGHDLEGEAVGMVARALVQFIDGI